MSLQLGGFEWRVLGVNNYRALILADRIIERREYGQSSSWKDSDIRAYLSGPFYNNTFMPNEKALILQYATGRDGTSDRVFLLSPQEIARYMSDGDIGGSKRLHADKQYIDDESNYLRIAYDMNGKPAWWYLRSPGGKDNLAMCVGDDGAVYISGHGITPEKAGAGGIRPAMMIKYRGEFNNA